MIIFLSWLACSQPTELDAQARAPSAIENAECEVCGMLVGEQPAPRGQVVYRNGHHAFTCSLEGLHALVSVRSPLGKPVGVYVEALPERFDWTQSSVEPHPWVAADEAFFVAGAKRSQVMGFPLLSFSEQPAARQAADSLGTQPHQWGQLLKLSSLRSLDAK